jgi:hypothetical protein
MKSSITTDDRTIRSTSNSSIGGQSGFGIAVALRMVWTAPIALALLTHQVFGQDGTLVTERIGDVPMVNSTSVESVNDPSIILAPTSNSSLPIQQPQTLEYGVRAGSQPVMDEVTPCAQCEEQPVAAKPQDTKPKVDPCATSHKPVFFDNDFSYLDGDGYSGNCLGDSLKNLGRCGNVDVGGQLRFRYHAERGMGQQAGATRFQDTDNNFLLTRLRLYTDVKMTENIRFFCEGIYADVLTANPEYIPRIIDRNYGDFLNLFFDVKLTDNTAVRIGRQELIYGAQRLVSPLDWANTRRNFEGVKVMSKYENLKVDAFWTQLVPPIADELDKGDERRQFWGTYSSYTGLENATIDLYYLGLDDNLGGRLYNTFGSRLLANKGDWLYELEGMAQTGNVRATGQVISSYAFTSGLGRKMPDMPWSPVVWAYYDYASGDSPGGSYSEFNDLFPLAHKYLGFIDAVLRRNVSSPNVQMVLSPTKRLKLLTWYQNFQSAKQDSPILSVGGTPAQDLTVTDFGNELDFLAVFNATARTEILAGYSHLWAGEKILSGIDADFFYLQCQTNF